MPTEGTADLTQHAEHDAAQTMKDTEKKEECKLALPAGGRLEADTEEESLKENITPLNHVLP